MARETTKTSKPKSEAAVRRSWKECLEDYVLFLTEHDRLPSQRAMDHGERKLHYWLRNQKASLRNGLLLPERVAVLDQRVPGWSASHRRHFGWDEMLAGAVAFHAETGRLPSLSSADSNE